MEAAAERQDPAPLFRRHARRPRLTRLLDESTAQAILLIAPPGYGKTVLAAEWLHGRQDAVWYRATAASADLAAFSAGLADVVAPIVPGAGERLRQRLRVAEAPERAARPLAELLAEDLAGWPAEALIVVDDYHLVAESTPVEEFVDWLLTLAPVRLLVTSRRRPIWASARRVLYGEITELGREQLAMNREEAGRVLGDRSDETVGALVTHAEGWPALIGLAALSASDEIPKERVSEALFRYFAEEVLRQEPPEVQRLMLLASVPATLSADVARTVLGFPEPEGVLARLVEAGLLHEREPSELRFHLLVRDFLRRKLEAEEPEVFEQLTQKAFAAARAAGNWEEAFDLALAGGREDLGAEITGEATPELLASGRVETVERWLAACGAAALDDPGAVLARAEVLTLKGNYGQAAGLARQLAETLTPESKHASRAWLAAGHALYLGSQSQAALECHERAAKLAVSSDDRKRVLWGSFLAESELEREGAQARLDEFESLSGDDLNARLRVASGTVIAAMNRASFAGTWDFLARFVPLADHATDPTAKSGFLAMAAYVHVAGAQYSEALQLAERARRVSSDLHHHFAIDSCRLYQAAAQVGLRQLSRAHKTLREISEPSADDPNLFLDTWRATLWTKLALAQGDPLGAVQMATEVRGLDEAPVTPRGELLGIKSIALVAAGKFEEGRQTALNARQVSRAIDATFFSRFGELLASLELKGAVPELKDELGRLFDDSVECRFLDGLVVAYRAKPELVPLLAEDRSRIALLRSLLDRTNDRKLGRSVPLGRGEARVRASAIQDTLTPREWEVLRLMAEGLSNSEIADRLFISRSTAKVHVHHILKKVGARTRLQAVLLWERSLRDDS